MLKVIGLGSILAATVATSALAADLRPSRAPVLKAPAMVASATDWSGFYIGASAGAAWTDNTIIDHDGFAAEGQLGHQTHYDRTGGIFGGQAGYNWQSGRVVFGLEGDLSYVSANGSNNRLDPEGLDETVRGKYAWLGTIRGRLGITVDRALIYATGGVAFARLKDSVTDFDDNDPPPGVHFDADDSFSATRTRVGWVVGGGVEYAFAPSWTLRVEGLYMDLGHRDYIVDTTTPTPGDPPRDPINARYTVENTMAVARVGLNYRFGGAPISARY
jgi:outer membrane immunogenic protein